MMLSRVDFGERKLEVSLGFVDKFCGPDVSRHIFIKPAGLIGARPTMQRIRNMFKNDCCQYYFRSKFVAGGLVLPAESTAKPYCHVRT